MVNESHTQFIEHVIFIMKNVLENSNNKNDQPAEHLGVTSIEGMMLAIVRLVPHFTHLKKKKRKKKEKKIIHCFSAH